MTFDIGSNLAAVLMALIAALGSFIAAYFAYKANTKSTATHDLVNGRMSQLLTATNAISRAQGVKAGVAGDLVVPPVPIDPVEILAQKQLNPPTGQRMSTFIESFSTALLLMFLILSLLHGVNGTLFSNTDSSGTVTQLGWIRSKF